MSQEGRVTEVYVVQRYWAPSDEWLDYRRTVPTVDKARELHEFAGKRSGFEGPWRIIHRVTAIVETVVDP